MPEEKRTYNGWSTYETWLVHVHLQNNEGDYRFWTATAEQAVEDAGGDRDRAEREFARMLKEHLDELVETLPSGSLLRDLAGAAENEIDYAELAQSWVGEVEEEEPSPEPNEED